MYGNGFFNPYMYQPYYQPSNLINGLNSIRNASSIGRAASLGSASGLGNIETSGLRGMLGKFSFSGFLNGASKTLNVVNQAIPIFYQVKPIINNAKTMFRIIGAVKDNDTSNNNTNDNNNTKNISTTIKNNTNIETFSEENPTFFI